MAIEFLSITADPAYAKRLWAIEGNTVMVDLEQRGKAERQRSRDTVLSSHTFEDAARVAEIPRRGSMLVRIEATETGGLTQIPHLAALGVERLMLPMFRDRKAVDETGEALERWGKGRMRLTLLAETDAAVRGIEEILRDQPPCLDQVHIGLNDLSLERETPFLFWPLLTGEIAELAETVRDAGRRFGFGGVGAPGTGLVPAERILGEHVRVGSEAVILSRSFHSSYADGKDMSLEEGITALRTWEEKWRVAGPDELETNHAILAEAIRRIGASTP